MPSKWEKVDESECEQTDRLKVEGGYLYKTVVWSLNTDNALAVTMVFVPASPVTKIQE